MSHAPGAKLIRRCSPPPYESRPWGETHNEYCPRGKTHRAFVAHKAYTAAMEDQKWKRTCIAAAALAVLASAGLAVCQGVSLDTLQFVALFALLAWASAEDLRSRTIPNACIVAALAVRAIYLAAQAISGKLLTSDIAYYTLSGAATMAVLSLFALAFEYATGRESMGGGDVKLYAVAGVYLGFERAMGVVLLSCILALLGCALAQAPCGKNLRAKISHTEWMPAASPHVESVSPAPPHANSASAASLCDKQASPQPPEAGHMSFSHTLPFGPAIAIAIVASSF